jgi:hypothetical protein
VDVTRLGVDAAVSRILRHLRERAVAPSTR